jgi:hypothetical protein
MKTTTFDPEADDQRAVFPTTRRGIAFCVGLRTITPSAHAALAASKEFFMSYVHRHAHGDFGEVLPDEKAANLRTARAGRGSVLSMYHTKIGEKLWIATDVCGHHSSTIIFTPDEIGAAGVFDEREERDQLAT